MNTRRSGAVRHLVFLGSTVLGTLTLLPAPAANAAGAAPNLTEFEAPLSSGSDIVAGPDGNLWFTNPSGNSVGRISTDGIVAEFAMPTPQASPGWITAGPDGNVWFTERIGKVGRITVGPKPTITEFPLPTAEGEPGSITSGPDGNLWISLSRGHRIARMTPAGQVSEYPIPTKDAEPMSITAGPDGNVWYAFSAPTGGIGKVSPDGRITEYPLASADERPFGLTTGPDGNLWFTLDAGNSIGRITPAGTISTFEITSSASTLRRITNGPDGSLWFVGAAGRVGKITPDGKITEFTLPSKASSPFGIATGADGNLWFTQTGVGKVGRMSPTFSITAPGATRNATATANDRKAVVRWVSPAQLGGSPVTRYTVSARPGNKKATVKGSKDRVLINGLENGTAYTFVVRATNGAGEGPPSKPSNRVMPVALAAQGSTGSRGRAVVVVGGGLALGALAAGAAAVARRRKPAESA